MIRFWIRDWFARDSFVNRKWFESDSRMIRSWIDSDSRVIRKCFACESKVIREWFENDSLVNREWFESYSRIIRLSVEHQFRKFPNVTIEPGCTVLWIQLYYRYEYQSDWLSHILSWRSIRAPPCCTVGRFKSNQIKSKIIYCTKRANKISRQPESQFSIT